MISACQVFSGQLCRLEPVQGSLVYCTIFGREAGFFGLVTYDRSVSHEDRFNVAQFEIIEELPDYICKVYHVPAVEVASEVGRVLETESLIKRAMEIICIYYQFRVAEIDGF